MTTPTKITDEIKRLESEASQLTRKAEALQKQHTNILSQIRQTRESLLIIEGQYRAFKSLLPEEKKPKEQKRKVKGGKKIG